MEALPMFQMIFRYWTLHPVQCPAPNLWIKLTLKDGVQLG